MIRDVLMLFGILLVVISYGRIVLIYFKSRNIEISDINGFDVAKEITSNYDEINIVKANDVRSSKYNIKRRVIRLSSKDYEENNIYSLAIAVILAGYSLINLNKDKYFKLYSSVFSNIGYISYSLIIGILISLFTNTVGDAKIGIVILGGILGYQYIRIQLFNMGYENVLDSVKKMLSRDKFSDVDEVLKVFLNFHTVSFIITLILMLREVLIIMNM